MAGLCDDYGIPSLIPVHERGLEVEIHAKVGSPKDKANHPIAQNRRVYASR